MNKPDDTQNKTNETERKPVNDSKNNESTPQPAEPQKTQLTKLHDFGEKPPEGTIEIEEDI